MKKLYKIIGITTIAVLYCFTISMVFTISQNSGFTSKTIIEKDDKDLSVSIKQLSNAAQAESIGNDFSNIVPVTIKDSKNEFSGILKIRELFFANEFTQYIFTARNFLIKYGKVNIIFPFHYFW